jgi:hypothetical protein
MVIIETPIFTKWLTGVMNDGEYRRLQMHLLNKPDAGKVFQGSGGLRKLRWSAKGHGKSGGVRIIYYWFVAQNTILLLFAYAKNERTDLTSEQLQQLRKIIEGEYP